MGGERTNGGHATRPGGPGALHGMLTLQELEQEVAQGSIDTIIAAFTDMQRRLMGKRIQGEFFLEEVAEHGVEGCNYLLALDMEMDPVPGYDMANWEKGYGDFGIAPDLTTLRRIPWLAATAYVLCDLRVEFSKGEAWYGQHELNVRYADAVTAADRHTIYKNGVKEIANLNGISATFMAKPSEKDIGSSCHIHMSLVDRASSASAFVDGDQETDVFRQFLGGLRNRVR